MPKNSICMDTIVSEYYFLSKTSGGLKTPNFRFFTDFLHLRSKLAFLAIFGPFERPDSLVGVPQRLLSVLIILFIHPSIQKILASSIGDHGPILAYPIVSPTTI